MKAINKYHEMVDTRTGEPILYVTSGTVRLEHMRAFEGTDEEKAIQEEEYKRIIQEKIDNGDRMPGKEVTLTTNTENKDDIVLRLERELTSVQSHKMKLIRTLAQIRLEKQQLENGDKSNDIVHAWAEAVMRSRRDQNGSSF
jgi:hypothetical protein